MKKLNVAIIGQGRSGRNIHGRFFRSELNRNFNVVAVVDALKDRRDRAAEEYGCDVYADYRELFNRKDVDLVINSTFSYMHAAINIDLAEHGFNVVCEKPFAKHYEDAARAVLAARKAGTMLNVFQQSRFAPYFKKIKEILAEGKLGEVFQISISFSGFVRRWDWQTSLGFAGGSVLNTGPHPLDQALDLLGFPEETGVFSRLGRANSFGDAEDYAKVILTAPGKPLIDVEISSCNAYAPYTYVIHAKNGSLCATQNCIEYKYFDPAAAPAQQQILSPLCGEDGLPVYCRETLDWKEEKIDIAESVFVEGVRDYYDMIYAYLTEGRPMEVCAEQVLKQLKVIDMIHAQNPLSVIEGVDEA